MDERRGDLRIATSRGKVPDPKVESQVDVLREGPRRNLSRVGALLEHLARGEDLRAIRYDDDRAYLVTFKKTDPLFVVDLADAKHSPAGARRAEDPRVFDLHPPRVAQDQPALDGLRRERPRRLRLLRRGAAPALRRDEPHRAEAPPSEKARGPRLESTATTDHHAFNYLPERGLLAIPAHAVRGRSRRRRRVTEVSFAGLSLYRVSYDGLRASAASHPTRSWRAHCGTVVEPDATTDVKRSVFLDDLVYSMATDRLKVQRMAALGVDVADLHLLP
jgi:hypothetical protein